MEATYSLGDALLIKKMANTIHTGDILYMEYPISDTLGTKTYFVQRVFGLPGDSFELIDKIAYVNGKVYHQVNSIKYNYFIRSNKNKLDSAFKQRYNLTEGGAISDDLDYSYTLTKSESDSLRKDTLIRHVEMKMEKKSSYDETCFPGSIHFKWNMDHYGKIYIPKVNDTLKLDTLSLKLYEALISTYEKNVLEVKRDSIFINGELTTHYVVKKNYFFVLGDNRDNANDSRVWGFLPDNYVVGKVVYTLRKTK